MFILKKEQYKKCINNRNFKVLANTIFKSLELAIPPHLISNLHNYFVIQKNTFFVNNKSILIIIKINYK